ncbi:MAG: acyl-CoA dehydrogenase, partial [Bacteroidetes bacterium]|nr:acyl-CoA dehydrogenase [Bacteroidota bacterium]
MSFLTSVYGALSSVAPWWALALGAAFVLFALGYAGAPFWLWAALGLATLVGLGAPVWLIGVAVAAALVFLIPHIRRVLSLGVMKTMKALNFLP